MTTLVWYYTDFEAANIMIFHNYSKFWDQNIVIHTSIIEVFLFFTDQIYLLLQYDIDLILSFTLHKRGRQITDPFVAICSFS